MADAVHHPSNDQEARVAVDHIKKLGSEAVDANPKRQEEIVKELQSDLAKMTPAERQRVIGEMERETRIDNSTVTGIIKQAIVPSGTVHRNMQNKDVDYIEFTPPPTDFKGRTVKVYGPTSDHIA